MVSQRLDRLLLIYVLQMEKMPRRWISEKRNLGIGGYFETNAIIVISFSCRYYRLIYLYFSMELTYEIYI